MKKFWILPVAVLVMFLVAGCGSESKDEPATGSENDFKAVDVGECRFDEPPISFKDRVYTEQKDEFSCKEYVEVTEKAEKTIKFNWFGEMRCGIDWEYGYKIEGIENNVLKVNILERDTDLDLAADCDECCYLMPIKYTASTAEEIDSVKTIEINYEGKNHKVSFPIEKETTDSETPDEEVPVQCEDSEGRIYNEGDSISNECRAAYCCGYGDWCEDGSECYHCPEIGGKMEWTCADGVTKVEWCECVEINDETYGTEWKCADRVDLNCPKE
ncbi:hypothetical protein J6Z19_05900 [bacterium]|nr:hypothetical protein [bacterium]